MVYHILSFKNLFYLCLIQVFLAWPQICFSEFSDKNSTSTSTHSTSVRTHTISGHIDTKATRTNTILVVGDSLSSAHGIDPKKGWVSLLGERLEQEKLPYQIVNISTSGDTTRNGLEKLNNALKTYQPSIVILGLGSNDGLRGLSTVAMQNNLNKMIEESKKSHAKLLLLGFLIPVNYGPVYRAKFEQVFKDLANKHHLIKVPFLLDKVALNPEYMQEDGLHPNELAQPIILDTVWVYLKKLL